jgi:hypothetical protein
LLPEKGRDKKYLRERAGKKAKLRFIPATKIKRERSQKIN